MGMMQEFKEFAVKGNVMDLAVGVIIGGAFGKIVDSAVKDLIMPLIGAVIGKIDFSNMYVKLAAPPAGVPHCGGEGFLLLTDVFQVLRIVADKYKYSINT